MEFLPDDIKDKLPTPTVIPLCYCFLHKLASGGFMFVCSRIRSTDSTGSEIYLNHEIHLHLKDSLSICVIFCVSCHFFSYSGCSSSSMPVDARL